MTFEETIERYFDAWNCYDAAKIAAQFAPTGTYSDPTVGLAVGPTDLQIMVDALRSPFPDFHFAITATIVNGSRACVEWLLTGVNSAPLKPGVDATGRSIHVAGVEVFEWADGYIGSATRYFDQKSMYEQIGMQAIIEPLSQGKATFGYSKRVASGNQSVPGFFGITWIHFRDQAELDAIRRHAASIVDDFLREPGFISLVTGAAGDRAFTVTAWENEEALHRAMQAAHGRAKQDFRTGALASGVWTSVWQPHHINRMWTQCPACRHPNDVTAAPTTCSTCGSTLPGRPEYW